MHASMKVVFIVAGYGTRLERDILENETYSHLHGIPKALLPIGEIPLLSRWIDIFLQSKLIDHVYIGTNSLHEVQFKDWASKWPHFISVTKDNSSCNEDRIGAVGCMQNVFETFNLFGEDVLVLAGDTLLYGDFKLKDMVQTYMDFKLKDLSSSLITVYQCSESDVKKRGIVEVDDNGKVKTFLEKPEICETVSRNASPCFYILSPPAVKQVSNFLDLNKNEAMTKRDSPGNFINFLHSKLPVFTYKISGRFDVGGLSSYIHCNDHFTK